MESGGIVKSLCDKYQRSVRLSEEESKTDPDSEPFRSKYSARELLNEIKGLLGQLEEGREEQPCNPYPADSPTGVLAVRLAVIELQLGVNHTETEELSAGEEHLVNSARLLEPYRLSQEAVSAYLQAQNNLGILWSGRGEIQVAQTYLESAESLYIQYMKQIGKPPLELHEHFMAREEQYTEQERFKRFEKVYTHTLYYLAQVYKHLEFIEKSAQYCHATLKRQLEFTTFNPVEWATNAATLSQYYLPEQLYMESRHCLAAANVILRQTDHIVPGESADEKQERLDLIGRRKAEIARCWIKYCLNLLQDATKKLEDNIGELDADRQCDLKAQRTTEDKEGERKKAVLFGSSDIYDSILAAEEKVACTYPLDFEEARELFLVGQHYVNEAKHYFQLDGHATDYIEILQDHSALFKVLAFFEEDYERRCKMHKRRIDMLEPVCNDLNPLYYLLICRQLQFELADTFYEMMDLKIAIGNKLEELDCHTIKKINLLALSAIKYYEMFLDSLKSPDKKVPERLEEDVVRPALVAKFHIARLYGKLITADGKKQLENMQTSLEYYSFLVEYCDKNEDAIKVVETELELSKEMATLLPTKMERLRVKLASFR
ncbi:KIF-binding protein isoform X2 [Ambystoma mexicanum]|uniref:KIF-binding protein isoform X2 n=1 Tax=Ambystoma mexicanum TaxID=8296 RepID=UPI0037E93CE5